MSSDAVPAYLPLHITYIVACTRPIWVGPDQMANGLAMHTVTCLTQILDGSRKTGHMLPKKGIHQNVFLMSQQCMTLSGRLHSLLFFFFWRKHHSITSSSGPGAPFNGHCPWQGHGSSPISTHMPHRHQIAIAGIVANKQREFMLAFYQQTNALIVWTWHDIVLDQKGPCIHTHNFLP